MKDDDGVRKAVAKSTVKSENIKVAASDPSLRGKIKVDINGPAEKVYWYIKFNLALDPSSVSNKTMRVMETNGYILNTIIVYDELTHLIVITPVDFYKQNEFYILTVTTDVKSAAGNNMKKDVHVLFKLMDNQITEFSILKSTAQIPEPKVKPVSVKMAELAEMEKSVNKAYYMDEKALESVKGSNIAFEMIKVNIAAALLGLALIFVSIPVKNLWLTIFSLAVCLAGIVHIVVQLGKGTRRSLLYYNIGAFFFNRSQYKAAHRYFSKAFALDPNNEMAEYVLNKIKHYLKT